MALYRAMKTIAREAVDGIEGFEDKTREEIRQARQLQQYVATMWGCRTGVTTHPASKFLYTPEVIIGIFFDADSRYLGFIRDCLEEAGYTRARKVEKRLG